MEEKAREELAKAISPQLTGRIQIEEAVRGRPFVKIIRPTKEGRGSYRDGDSQTGIRHSHLGSTAEGCSKNPLPGHGHLSS